MFRNNALAQALLCLSFLMTSHSLQAMDNSAAKSYPSKYICIPARIMIGCPTGNNVVDSVIKVKSPQLHWSPEQRKQYFDKHREKFLSFMDKTLTIYRLHQNKRSNNNKATLFPHSLLFYPDTSSISIVGRKHCYTVPSLGIVSIQMKNKAHVDMASNSLVPGPSTVSVTANNKSITIDVAKLYEIYPSKNELNLKKETQKTIFDKSFVLALQYLAHQRSGLPNNSNVIAPDDYLYQLQNEDLENMVTYYLLNHDVEL